jgi:hypothetical protein
MSKVSRPGSGRTKGSFSFVKISLQALNNKFADKTTNIVVSRKFAETVGFTGLVSNPANHTLESISGEVPETQVAVKVTNPNE